MFWLYRAVTFFSAPFVPIFLRLRQARGKEDSDRLSERLGHPSASRPEGKLLWVHAASVGEANSAFALLETLLQEPAGCQVLLTTVTVTSAALMAKRLAAWPGRARHQFAPVDTPQAVRRFLRHWRPDIALWIDSELWPNLILETQAAGARIGMVNARLSERSFRRWKLAPGFIAQIVQPFAFCFAQTAADAERLQALGMRQVTGIGNLKYDAPVLACDECELARLRAQIGKRPIWLAASTHPGEEEQVARVHGVLKAEHPTLLTLLVPRHAARGPEIRPLLAPLHVAQRSQGEPIGADTDIYLADTMGELGLFYRLAPMAFIGGSLVPHGGQNPLEGAKLHAALVVGPHMRNFAAIVSELLTQQALIQVRDAEELVVAVRRLLDNDALRLAQAKKALAHVREKEGTLGVIMRQLRATLS